MSAPGRKPRPALQVIRGGNPGHRPVTEGVVLPPAELVEPDWPDLLPGEPTVAATAAELWARTAPTLARSISLVRAQQEALVDYCITWARIVQGEQALTREGVVITSHRADRGLVRNPWMTVLNQHTGRTSARSPASSG